MHHLKDDAPPFPPSAHPSTGPRTPEGKAISSLNAIQHGCRSEKTVLPHEDPTEFEALVDQWFAHYQPTDPAVAALVEQTARAHWFLKRAAKRLEDVEWELPENALNFTDAHHKPLALHLRYKTAAERSFTRFFNGLEALCDRNLKKEETRQRALDRAAKLEIQWGSQLDRCSKRAFSIYQSVEVEQVDGVTVTTCYPSNERIKQEVASREDPVHFITRVLRFDTGVPPAYHWARPNLVQLEAFAIANQKFPYPDWLEHIETETASSSPHLLPRNPVLLQPGAPT